jgi:GT2 family glycosyltransferase
MERPSKEVPVIDVTPLERSSTDIIIPFHGQYELVTQCVGAISSCTPNQDYTVYLVDDGSPNKNFLELISSVNKKIKPIQLDKQQGFGAALEAGFKEGNGQTVVFMHSDVRVDNIYWLSELQKTYINLRKNGVKLVSSRSNSAGSSANGHPLLNGSLEESSDVISDSALPLFCTFCHRELFKRIGGFVKNYPFAWFEDEELFWRMKYFGYKQAISGTSYVTHKGSATINELCRSEKIKKIMEGNRELCLKDVNSYIRKK